MVVNVLSLISLISLSLLFARLRFASNASKNARLFKKKHKENKRDYDDDLPRFTTKEEVCFQNEISVVVAKKNTNQRNTLQIRFQSGVVEENRV